MDQPVGSSVLHRLVADAVLPAELAALVLVLAEQGVPLVVAGPAAVRDQAASLRGAFSVEVLRTQPSRDTVAGGVVIGTSLEDVLRVLGAPAASDHEHAHEIPDEVRDLGVVLILGENRVNVAHYVRPVERDGAGHLQRRPPAVLGAWNELADDFDDFWWALTEELAARAGLDRGQLEDSVDARRRWLAGGHSGPGPADARH